MTRVSTPLSLLCSALVWMTAPIEAPSATMRVPSDHPTIQAAIDSATHGDEIIVATGTYLERLFIRDQNIIIRSTDPDDWSVVEATIIDASQTGRVVSFRGGETEECVLTGFTIRNGRGTQGGGIAGRGTHATIRNNLVVNNTVHVNAEGFGRRGAGIDDCDGLVLGNRILNNIANEGGGLANCDGIIEGNTISGNEARDYIVFHGGVRGFGGGLYECHGEIRDNTITHNEAGLGGGLRLCSGNIVGNRIVGNRTRFQGDGGGLAECDGLIADNEILSNTAEAGRGGGLFRCGAAIIGNTIRGNVALSGGGAHGCQGLISENHFHGNECFLSVTPGAIGANVSYGRGGALDVCTGLIERNLFLENRAVGGTYRGVLGSCEVAGAYGGAISGGTGTLQNNLFIGNECVTGACVSPDPNPGISRGGSIRGFEGEVVHNTFVENRGSDRGGALADCSGVIRNNIFWLNTADEGAQIQASSLPDHCLIQDWTGGGVGNIDLDPRFVDLANGDLHLRHDSPCIDSGVLIASVTDDYDGNPRPFKWSTQYGGDGSGYDMGAYEFYPGPDVNYDHSIDGLDLFVFQQDWLAVSGPEASESLLEDTDLRVDQTVWKSTTSPDIYTPSGTGTDMDGNGEVDVYDLLELLEGMR